MNWIKNRKIRTKLLFIVAVSMMFMIAIGIVGIYYLKVASVKTDSMYKDRLLAIVYLEEAKSAYLSMNVDQFEFMVTLDLTRNDELVASMKEKSAIVEDNIDKYANTSLDPFEITNLKLLKDNWNNAKKAKVDVDALAFANKNAEAYALCLAMLAPINQQITKNMDDLYKYNIDVASQLNNENKQDAQKASIIITCVIILAVVLSFSIAILVINMISKPINNMASYIRKVAEGDVSKGTLGEVNKLKLYDDEIGDLGNSVIQMSEKLGVLLTKVADSSQQVASSSLDLTSNMQETSSGIEETATAVSVIASGVDNQMRSIKETSNIIQHITTSIQQMSTNSNETANAAKSTLNATKEGEKAIIETKEQIGNIQKTVSELDHVIIKLGERSNEIGLILETISNIAEQTNLLALNAAIEAARAGEQGKGFAVVAEEVRKLAEGAGISTKQIALLVSQIQQDTNQAIASMHDGTEQVKIGMEVVHKAGTAFDSISSLVQHITEQIQEISSSSQDILNESKKIESSIKDVESLSGEVSMQSQSISASVEEQTAAIQVIATSSENLAKVADGLNTEVNKFKL